MKIILCKNAFLFLLILMSSYGFAPRELASIETAIMRQDYPQVKSLAEHIFKQEVSTEIKNKVYYYLGLSHLYLMEYSQAKEVFNALSQRTIPPDLRDKVYLGLGDVYYLSDQYVQAEKVLRELLKVHSQSSFLSLIYYKLARVNLRRARWEEAQIYLNKIIHEFPRGMDAFAARQLLKEEQYFGVQIGSFLERPRAEKLAQELRKKGDAVYIVETRDQQRRKFFRVRVGRLDFLNEAKELQGRLFHQGYPAKIFP